MLIDSVWQKIHTTNIGMFCILCAEKRLGRILTKADFNSSHINRISPGQSKSNRLLQRLHNEIYNNAIENVMEEHQKQCKLLQDELKKYCNSLKQ